MWLLDANMDAHLLALLRQFGVESQAATRRGRGALDNGELVRVAAEAGFTCLLTQDRLFGQSATDALNDYPSFSVIVVHLPQGPWREYQERFRSAWAVSPIQPAPGPVLHWPPEPVRAD